MRSRLAGTVMLSTVVFFVVAVLVSVGVLWWSGDVALGIAIGGICGLGTDTVAEKACPLSGILTSPAKLGFFGTPLISRVVISQLSTGRSPKL
jgi:hypothetical protein